MAEDSIERTWQTSLLEPRVADFLVKEIGGISLDIPAEIGKRPDYACLRGMLLVEIKALQDDPEARLAPVLESLRSRSDWPKTYGNWPLFDSVIRSMDDPTEIYQTLGDRIARRIRKDIQDANKQIRAYKARHPRQNTVGMVIIINEDHAAYSPDLAQTAIIRELRQRGSSGGYRNSDIDEVIYISERHAAVVGGGPAFLILSVGGPLAPESSWKRRVAGLLASRWARFNRRSLKAAAPNISDYVEVEDVPKSVPRSELWGREYRGKPYMRKWTDEEVRDYFTFLTVMTSFAMGAGVPFRVPSQGRMELMRGLAHIEVEMATRRLQLPYLEPTAALVRTAINKIPFGPETTKWLENAYVHILDLPEND